MQWRDQSRGGKREAQAVAQSGRCVGSLREKKDCSGSGLGQPDIRLGRAAATSRWREADEHSLSWLSQAPCLLGRNSEHKQEGEECVPPSGFCLSEDPGGIPRGRWAPAMLCTCRVLEGQ